MIREVMTETVKYMWRNKKNRLFMVVSLGVVLFHTLFILPNTPGLNEVDIVQLEREMLGNEQTFEDNLAQGATVPSAFTGTSAYEAAVNEYVSQRQLYTALMQGNAKQYLEVDYRPDIEERAVVSEELNIDLPILGSVSENSFESLKSQFYINNIEPLSFHTIHERTSLQQIHLFLIGMGPILLFLGTLFLISDVTVKDRKLKTQKAGVPMNWFGYLSIQSITALGFVLIFYAFLATVFFLTNGILHGFGSLELPAGLFQYGTGENMVFSSPLELTSIGLFLLTALPYFLLFMYLITRLNTLFSLLLKQEVVVLIVGVFTILFQQFYYGPETKSLLGINISWYPQSYLNFGEVVTGRVNETLLMTNFYSRGLIVIMTTIVIVEILNYVTSKWITRQIFVR